jgi:WD40 repeat protein
MKDGSRFTLKGQTLKGHTSYAWSVAFSPNGRRLAAAADNTVKVWHAATGPGCQHWIAAVAAGLRRC